MCQHCLYQALDLLVNFQQVDLGLYWFPNMAWLLGYSLILKLLGTRILYIVVPVVPGGGEEPRELKLPSTHVWLCRMAGGVHRRNATFSKSCLRTEATEL